MSPYLILFTLLGFYDFILKVIRNGRKFPGYAQLSFIPLLIVLLFFGLRYNVGTDWNSYRIEFENLSKYAYSWKDQYFEPGYYFLERIILLFNGSFVSLQLLIVAICIFTIGATVKGNGLAQILIYGVSTGFFLWGLSGIRQFLSILVVHYTLVHWKNMRILKRMCLLILSVSFHYSSIVFILIPIVKYLSIIDKKIVRIGVLTICLFLGLSSYSEAIVGAFFSSSFIGLIPFEKSTFGAGFVLKLVSYLLILGWSFRDDTRQIILLRRLFFLGVCFELFIIQNVALGRLSLMYTGLEYILLLSINQDIIKRKMTTSFIILNSFIVLRTIGLLWRGISDVTPYQNIVL